MSVYILTNEFTPIKEKIGLLRNVTGYTVEYAVTKGNLPEDDDGVKLYPNRTASFDIQTYQTVTRTMWLRLITDSEEVSKTFVVDHVVHDSSVDYNVSGISEWTTQTLYMPRQLVLASNALYCCKVEHTSSSSFSGDIGNWDAIAAASDKEAWDSFLASAKETISKEVTAATEEVDLIVTEGKEEIAKSIGDLSSYVDTAQNCANSASGSADSASSSATSATASASSASNSAVSASESATLATNYAKQALACTKTATYFYTSGTYVVPSGITKVYVSGCGGGAGGSAIYGGGGAQAVMRKVINVTAGESISVTIGAGGAGRPSSSGSYSRPSASGGDGGTTKFGSYLTLYGGKGAQYSSESNYISQFPERGGEGGTAGSPATIQNYFTSSSTPHYYLAGGSGGDTLFGKGGKGGYFDLGYTGSDNGKRYPAYDGIGYGSGGGSSCVGFCSSTTFASAAGSGANGVLIVEVV